ncbi:uncharacterized protein LOC135109482 [Scylla paramamosain]|uniref:uncharacterized protein LOC135109482 n=1 Tax=Scylla paramamosain TaxID=85552 RepID=UPI0030832E29
MASTSGMDNVKAIHDSFWALADFNIQNNFIQKYCVKGEVKRRRVQQRGDGGDAYKRKCTRAYSLSCGGTNISVCATAFRNVLGVTSRRVYNAVDRVNPTGTPRADRRGKHVPKHAMPLSRKNLVECHIKSFPTVSSHYTRAKSPLMRYLDTEMTMKKMYFLYKEWLFDNHEDEEPVTFSYYKKVVQGFRLGFKPPSTDTCSKCDRYEVSKKDANTEEEAQGIQAQWDEHLSFAKEGMKAMADMQKDNDPDTRCICLDLQQTLPVPRLCTNIAYYKRKLWVYNLCIHNLKTKKNTFYVWDEMNADRGSVEVATCIARWIEDEQKEGSFTTLKIVSDNCGGQNKNINIILFYLRLIHSTTLQNITHTYLIPGHSYMACDHAFGHIEKYIRRVVNIYDLKGYVRAIKLCTTSRYHVIVLRNTDFLDFEVLQKSITHRKPKPPYSFQDTRSFQLLSTFCEGYFICRDYSGQAMGSVRLMKGQARYTRRMFDLSAVQLPQKYPTIRRLQPGKLQHLQQLLEFIPNVNQPYLQFIIRKQQELDNTEEDDSTEDEDEDHLEYDSDSEDIVDDPQPLQDEDNTVPPRQRKFKKGAVPTPGLPSLTSEDHQGRKKHTSKEVQLLLLLDT